jgi:hypothetical protein
LCVSEGGHYTHPPDDYIGRYPFRLETNMYDETIISEFSGQGGA